MAISLTWTGADGTVWNLSPGQGPVWLDGRDVEGLGQPAWDRNTLETAGRDGQRRTGLRSRAKPREGFLPVVIGPDNPADWQRIQRAWWNSWSPDLAGTLTVNAPDGSARSISCYLNSDDTWSPAQDPSLIGLEKAGVSWIADDPWWYGTPTVQVYGAALAGDFLANGTAPPFNLSGQSVSGSMSLLNTGDMPAGPRFTMTAGTTAFSITIDGKTIAGSITVPAGSVLVVNADAQTALLIDATGTATNVIGQLTAVEFTTLAVGAASAISASLTGTGTLTVSFAPRFKRAI